MSPHPLSPDGVVPLVQKSAGALDRRQRVRNIEVPSSNLQGASSSLQGAGGQEEASGCRPTTAPQQSLHRSPTHPHYKEAEYHQTRLTLRYDGPGEDQDTDLVGGYILNIYRVSTDISIQ